jgi:hypothetical protein
MLAGSIANAKLTNSSVTVGSTSIALGATSTTLDGVNIGATTAGTAAFSTLSASSTVSGTGFSTYLASPPAIGGTAAAAGTFTTLSGTTSVTTPIVKSASSLTLQSNGTTTAVTIDTSQNLAFNSGYGSVATAYGCRAWATFVGSSGAISGSGNCSSITRNSAGDYTFNFSTALTDGNYAITGACKPTSSQANTSYGRGLVVYYNGTPSTTAFRFLTITSATVGPEDFDKNYVAVFR